jgi:hypothetical protein
MKKYVREMSAAKSVSALVIFKGSRHVATVQMYYGNACLVNVWQESDAYIRSAKARKEFTDDTAAFHAYQFQSGAAYGSWYDKATAALSGLIIDGHEMTDHCSRHKAPKKPDGMPCYPRDFKAPAGYSLANGGEFSRETGRQLRAYDWQEKATAALGANADWNSVLAKANELAAEWRASGDCVSGFADCYREAGLEFLKRRGYRVISAI